MARIFVIAAATWVLVLFCAWMPTPGSALKCHVCNSLENEFCDNLKDDRYLIDCAKIDAKGNKNHTNCRKEIFAAVSTALGLHTERTFRSCGYEKHPRQSCFYSSNIDLKGSTCECTIDGCNGGNMLHFASKVLLVVLCGFLASLLT